jgi:hypothetical protein
MVPFVVVAIGCKLNELSGLGEAVDGRPRAGIDELLRFPIFLFRSSRRSDLRGETLNAKKKKFGLLRRIIIQQSEFSFISLSSEVENAINFQNIVVLINLGTG